MLLQHCPSDVWRVSTQHLIPELREQASKSLGNVPSASVKPQSNLIFGVIDMEKKKGCKLNYAEVSMTLSKEI